jgi:hypothetical protein
VPFIQVIQSDVVVSYPFGPIKIRRGLRIILGFQHITEFQGIFIAFPIDRNRRTISIMIPINYFRNLVFFGGFKWIVRIYFQLFTG